MSDRPDDGEREDEAPAASSSEDAPDDRNADHDDADHDGEDIDPEDGGDRDHDDTDGDREDADDDREDDSADDSQPVDTEPPANDEGDADRDAAAEDDADESTGDDGASGDESSEGEGDDGEYSYEEPNLANPSPSAEEWLEEHGGPEEAPGMDMEPDDGGADGDAGEDAEDGATDDDDSSVKGRRIDDPPPAEALENQKTLAERGYEGPSESAEGEADEGPAEDAREARANATADDPDAGDGDDAPDARAAEDATTASASAPVSTSDPGKNAPAGMGKPAPAGGGGGATGGSTSFPDFDGEMAPDDQEQPLTEHIEEMTHRFLVVALVMGLVASVALLWSDDMINFLWYSFLGPGDGTCPGPQCPLEWRPHVYHPLSLLLARLKVAALVGFVAGLPVAVYQTYRFMRPGLYPHERRYYLAAVPTSLVLAIGGVAFAYFVVLPSLFIYFSAYSTQAAELAFALSDTFNLMVMLLGFFALIFQIPLLVMLAIMMGVVTRRWLEQRRIYFWTGFGGVAFIFSPDPTGMAPLLVALTMIALFEGTLMLLRWTERSVALFSAETMENNRPYAWALAAFVGYVVSTAPVPDGYFGALPPVFVDTLTQYGYVGFTPAIIAVGIALGFEILGWIARRVGAGRGARQGLQVRLAFIRIRPFVWLLAVVVGYMGSPDPELLDVFRQVDFGLPIVVGTVFALIALWEGVRLVLSYVRPN